VQGYGFKSEDSMTLTLHRLMIIAENVAITGENGAQRNSRPSAWHWVRPAWA
jgi:hypothetical protein